MKKHIVGVLVAGIFVTGGAFAAMPSRPNLSEVLNKRPSLSNIKKVINSIPMPIKDSSMTGHAMTGQLHSGNVMSGTKPVGPLKGTIYSTPQGSWQEDAVLGKQNAEDVKAFREENGYIIRYLKKSTASEKKATAASIESAVKTLLTTQKNMIKTYEAAAKTTTLMTREAWNSQTEAAVNAYKGSVISYIDTTKLAEFEKFITGRVNLLKSMFDKLETIRKVKTQ